MWFIKDNYATIWKMEDKGNYSLGQVSTSRKEKTTGEYANSSWSFVRFVGKAHEKSASLIDKEGYTRIKVILGGISREPYMEEGEKLWPKNPAIVIFDYEEVVSNSSNKSEDLEDRKEEVMPF